MGSPDLVGLGAIAAAPLCVKRKPEEFADIANEDPGVIGEGRRKPTQMTGNEGSDPRNPLGFGRPRITLTAGLQSSVPEGALYVSYDGVLEPLGAAQVVPYTEGLARRGFHVDVLSFEKPTDLDDARRREARSHRFASSGITWRCLRYHRRPTLPATLLDVALGAREIVRWAQARRGAKILHLRGYVSGLMGLLSRHLHGAKLLFDTRSFMVDERIESGMWAPGSAVVRLARMAERRLLAGADAVAVVSRAGAHTLPRARRDAVPARVRVIPPCADLDAFRPVPDSAALKAELGLAAGLAIVHSGALSTWYLAPYTFQVGAEFARRSGGTFVVLTRELEFAHSLNEKLRAGALVRSLEHSEMPHWLGAFDAGLAVVRPNRAKRGSMPVKLGEYLACGLAVAATGSVGDVAEHLSGSPVALPFDPASESPSEIAIRLLKAAAHPNRATVARALAERLYSLERAVEAYAALYEELFSCAA